MLYLGPEQRRKMELVIQLGMAEVMEEPLHWLLILKDHASEFLSHWSEYEYGHVG